MRRAVSLGLALATCSFTVIACGSSARHKTAPRPSAATSATSTTSATPASTSVRAPSGPNPNAPEINASGDIPDNQVFVKFTSPDGAYSLDVPEGWARTATGAATTFTDHFNSIRIDATKQAAAPSVATVQSTELPALQRSVPGFGRGAVSTVDRKAGRVVLVTYRADSTADPVTGKRVSLDVERYEFWHNGTTVTLTLSAPTGSDNVDPWKRVTDSFAWSR